MQTRIAKVSPSTAKGWLEQNTINRPLRRSVVDGYKAAYQRGEHRLTHQGIAFAESGELLDGQHRLTAISEMPPGFALELMVTSGLGRDAFEAIDQGLKRSHGDVLGIPSAHAGVARFLATIYETSRVGITSQYLVPFVEGTDRAFHQLVGFCPRRTKVWSSAQIQSAAVIQILNGGDKDYICMTYWALNHMDFDSMPAIAQTLFRQQTKGLLVSKGYDLYCRAFKAFDVSNQSLNRVQISDPSTIIGKTRDIIQSKVLGMKKAPSAGAGAKKVNGANSTKKAVAA